MDNSLRIFAHHDKYWEPKRHERIKHLIERGVENDLLYFNSADHNLCCELADLATAAVARLATQAFRESEYLQLHVIVILAKASTKLKVISARPKVNSQIALSAAAKAISTEQYRRL